MEYQISDTRAGTHVRWRMEYIGWNILRVLIKCVVVVSVMCYWLTPLTLGPSSDQEYERRKSMVEELVQK